MTDSPPAKRTRLSSPTFDDQLPDLSQDDIDALDSLDAFLDDDNPFRVRIHAPSSASEQDLPPEVDYAAWFNSGSSTPLVGFSAAASAFPGFQRPSAKGETTKSLFVPSTAALREAEEKMRKWQEDAQAPTHSQPDTLCSTQTLPPQATFSSARNAYSVQAPETPTPASLFRSANAELTPSKPPQSLGTKRQTRPFRSPLITAPTLHRPLSTPSVSSPLRGNHSSVAAPSQSNPAVSPLRPSPVANHAMTQKPLGFTPRHGCAATRPKFVTPFKTVTKPAPLRASVFENIKLPPTPSNPRTIINRIYPPSVSSPRPSKQNTDGKIFDLSEHRS